MKLESIVHGLPAATLDLVDPIAVPQVPSQPRDAGLVRHVAAGHEQVATASDEVRGIEDRLEFIHGVAASGAGIR
jgi:hypothetical protein